MNTTNRAPVFLNLLRIQLPVMALLSIAHRASGILMFFAIPGVALLLDRSLSGPEGYAWVAGLTESTVFRLLLIVIAWSLIHHLLAGIRFLLLDIDIGLERSTARASAFVVNIAALVLTVLVAIGLFL